MKIFISFLALSFCAVTIANAKSCIFCHPEILERQSVFEGEYFRVLPDSEPRVRGHLLVIPKRHIMKAHELSQEEWAEFSLVIPKAVKVFSEFLNTDQYIILEKNGPNAFQHIPHVHFHLFPIHSEAWSEIFDIVPDPLTPNELEKEVDLFRHHFLSIDHKN
jgi:diadenosine tetraphosphate (Ap4A) HIT family hydrolase